MIKNINSYLEERPFLKSSFILSLFTLFAFISICLRESNINILSFIGNSIFIASGVIFIYKVIMLLFFNAKIDNIYFLISSLLIFSIIYKNGVDLLLIPIVLLIPLIINNFLCHKNEHIHSMFFSLVYLLLYNLIFDSFNYTILFNIVFLIIINNSNHDYYSLPEHRAFFNTFFIF